MIICGCGSLRMSIGAVCGLNIQLGLTKVSKPQKRFMCFLLRYAPAPGREHAF